MDIIDCVVFLLRPLAPDTLCCFQAAIVEIRLRDTCRAGEPAFQCSLKTKVLFMISSAWCCGSYIDRVFQHRIDPFINFFLFCFFFCFFLFRSFPAGCLLIFHVPRVLALACVVVPYAWAVPSGMYGIEGMGTHCISVWRLAGACGVHMKERFARLEGFPSKWIVLV